MLLSDEKPEHCGLSGVLCTNRQLWIAPGGKT